MPVRKFLNMTHSGTVFEAFDFSQAWLPFETTLDHALGSQT